MAKTHKPLRGVLPAPITPFSEDGTIRYDLVEKHFAFLLRSGAAGLFACGTTGEGAFMSSDERRRIFKILLDHAEDDQLRCVVVLAPDTTGVLQGIDAIADLEPDYISCVTPYYLGAGQSQIIGHYTAVADRCPVPLVLYNIPQNTHSPMALRTVLELAAHPNIAGIKDSSGDFMQFQKGFLANESEDFTWIQGEDLLDGPSLLLGGTCIVTGLGNVTVEPYVAMFRAAEAGDRDAVLNEQRRVNALASIIPAAHGRTIAAIKAAVESLGRTTRHLRVPSMTASTQERDAVLKILPKINDT